MNGKEVHPLSCTKQPRQQGCRVDHVAGCGEALWRGLALWCPQAIPVSYLVKGECSLVAMYILFSWTMSHHLSLIIKLEKSTSDHDIHPLAQREKETLALVEWYSKQIDCHSVKHLIARTFKKSAKIWLGFWWGGELFVESYNHSQSPNPNGHCPRGGCAAYETITWITLMCVFTNEVRKGIGWTSILSSCITWNCMLQEPFPGSDTKTHWLLLKD